MSDDQKNNVLSDDVMKALESMQAQLNKTERAVKENITRNGHQGCPCGGTCAGSCIHTCPHTCAITCGGAFRDTRELRQSVRGQIPQNDDQMNNILRDEVMFALESIQAQLNEIERAVKGNFTRNRQHGCAPCSGTCRGDCHGTCAWKCGSNT